MFLVFFLYIAAYHISIQDNKTHGSEEMSNISESELVSLRGLWGKTWVKLNVAIRLKSVASRV